MPDSITRPTRIHPLPVSPKTTESATAALARWIILCRSVQIATRGKVPSAIIGHPRPFNLAPLDVRGMRIALTVAHFIPQR
jgi:hypothetical protein